MAISITELRQDIYTKIDEVIKTGQPLELERKGHKLKIVLEKKRRAKLKGLINRSNIITCTDEELVSNDWIKEWNHE